MTKVLYIEHDDDNLYMLKMRLERVGDFEVLAALGKFFSPARGGTPLSRPPSLRARILRLRNRGRRQPQSKAVRAHHWRTYDAWQAIETDS